jgi:hypothetical protein
MQLGCVSVWRDRRRAIAAAIVGIVCVGAAAFGIATPSAVAAKTAHGAAASSGTVWLCRPGQADDPCAFPLTATVLPSSGARTLQGAQDASSTKFDCFYVYPTVSTQATANSNLTVQSAEIGAAVAQASRFSQVCRVWAPMYRQRTELSLLKGLGADPQTNTVAYDSLLSAFKDYLANDNDGRPIIFIGHSQGAAMLIRLLSTQVDPDPTLRARTVVAILAGGNVTVPSGKTVGATFQHLPLCTAASQTGCVIAYSSFPSQPPADSDFGRPGMGVSLQSGQTTKTGVQVACVNPAAISGGSADLSPYFLAATSTPPPPAVKTSWVTYPGLYSAACKDAGGASWLQVNTLTTAHRPVVSETLGPAWGYHLDDINLALGNLLTDVRGEELAYTHSH